MSESNGFVPLEDSSGAPASLPDELKFAPAEPAPPVSVPEAAPAAAAAPMDANAPALAPTPAPTQMTAEQVEQQLDAAAQRDPAFAGVLRELRDTRGKFKALKGDFQTVEQQNNELRQVAQLLASRPDIVHALQTGQPLGSSSPQPPAGPDPRELADLQVIAQANGLYKPDGSGELDLDMAQKFRAAVTRTAEDTTRRLVEQEVKPLKDRVTEADRQQALATAMSAAEQLEIPPDLALGALSQLDAQSLQNPQIVATALATVGFFAIKSGRTAKPAPAPAPPTLVLQNPTIPVPPQEGSTIGAGSIAEIGAPVRSVINSHGLSQKSVESTLSRLAKQNPAKNFILED